MNVSAAQNQSYYCRKSSDIYKKAIDLVRGVTRLENSAAVRKSRPVQVLNSHVLLS